MNANTPPRPICTILKFWEFKEFKEFKEFREESTQQH